MARIKLASEDDQNLVVKQVFDEIKSVAGQVPAAYRAFGRVPNILQANWNRTKNVLGKGNLDKTFKEQIALAVSFKNGCHFCVNIHENNLRKAGFSDVEIEKIKNAGADDEKMDFVLKFVVKATSNPHEITDYDFDKLKNFGFSEEDILEILTTMEMYTGYNKIIIALNLQIED